MAIKAAFEEGAPVRLIHHFLLSPCLLAGCTSAGNAVQANDAQAQAAAATPSSSALPFQVQEVGRFQEPWAMAFIGDGSQALVTEKKGRLLLWSVRGHSQEVAGVPAVDYGGQGGLGDIVPHPRFRENGLVYLSWVEAGPGGTRGAAVGRARLVTADGSPRLEGLQVIWRQSPKLTGRGHFGHRIAFSPDGRHLFISSGERQHFTPAQDMNANLGKVVRLNDDGSVPPGNPWASQGGLAAQYWTMGHRNPLGLAFAPDGQLWLAEMGPRGGDELNLIRPGQNYGWPRVSNGDHYEDEPVPDRNIPDHAPGDGFAAPAVWWNPSISPSSLLIYTGGLFPRWRGDAFIGALSGKALIRIDIEGTRARKADQWDMATRIREVEQGPDGAIYLLEDGRGSGGRLLKLTPMR